LRSGNTASGGELRYHNRWITDLEVDTTNGAVVVQIGRTRWKIENEQFNVHKNHGYELTHNYGHGQQTLSMVFYLLNLLAYVAHVTLALGDRRLLRGRQGDVEAPGATRDPRVALERRGRPGRVVLELDADHAAGLGGDRPVGLQAPVHEGRPGGIEEGVDVRRAQAHDLRAGGGVAGIPDRQDPRAPVVGLRRGEPTAGSVGVRLSEGESVLAETTWRGGDGGTSGGFDDQHVAAGVM